MSALFKSIFINILATFLYSTSVFAQTQCTAQQIQNFTNNCDQNGAYVAGLETSCVSSTGSHNVCGFYPLPSEVRVTPTGLSCVITWIESPSKIEGTAHSFSTGSVSTLNCSIPPSIPIPAKNAGSLCSSQSDFGNPINAGIGNKHQHEIDYLEPGKFPLKFERTYNSTVKASKNMGVGWSSSYTKSLSFMTNGVNGVGRISIAALNRSDGKQHTFTQSGSGAPWLADADVVGILVSQGVDISRKPNRLDIYQCTK